MSSELAVFTPQIGVTSESFIDNHINLLYDEGTCVVANRYHENTISPNYTKPIFLIEKKHENENWLKVKARRFLENRNYIARKDKFHSLKKFLIEQQVKVILAEYLDYSTNFIDLANELGITFYAHAHGYDVSINLRDDFWKKKYLELNRADGIITVSEYSKNLLVDIGISESKISVIPCGVNLPKEKSKSDPSHISVLAVGRMVSKKAPILLLDAFRRALEVNNHLKLTYIGDGPLYPAVWQYIKAYKLEGSVTLLGKLPNEEVKSHLNAADIFIQHSITCPVTGDQEGLPVAILEAMSYGIPVVSTLHTGIPEAINDNNNGLLVEELDVAGMGQAIVRLAESKQLRKEFGAAAQGTVQARFSWDIERSSLLHLMKLKR